MKKWMLAGLLLILVGCSTKTLYSWLDKLIPWKIDKYVNMTKSQERLLAAALTKQLDWHRHNELTVYLAQLTTLQQQVQQPMTSEQVMAHFATGSEHWKRLLRQILPDVVAFAQTLSDEQVDEIKKQLVKELRKDRIDHALLTPFERGERTAKKIEKNVRKWMGRLSHQQQALIQEYTQERQHTAKLWFTYRLDWIEQLIAILDKRGQGQAFLTEQLTTLLVYPERLKGQEYLAEINTNRERLAEKLVEIHAQISPWQQRTLQRKLAGLHDDLNQLMQ